eukprot:1794680-Pyramimonas_sp.AAC.1
MLGPSWGHRGGFLGSVQLTRRPERARMLKSAKKSKDNQRFWFLRTMSEGFVWPLGPSWAVLRHLGPS